MDDKIKLYKMKTMLLEALFNRIEILEKNGINGEISLEDSMEYIKLWHEISIGNYSRVIELDAILDDLTAKSDEVISRYKSLSEEIKLYKNYLMEKGLANDFEKWVNRRN